ncbi:MAG: DNA-processing protein DprA [Pseudomonadota bacterium]
MLETYLKLTYLRSQTPPSLLMLLQSLTAPEEIFSLNNQEFLQYGISEKKAQAIKALKKTDISASLQWLEQNQCHFISIIDPNYPGLLKEIAHPPIGLFVIGDMQLLKKPQLAVIGARKPTTFGRETAKGFSRELTRQGFLVTSGMALGIDAAAHQGALEIGETVAVLGHGLDIIYPKDNLHLAQQIANSGLLVSEFPIGVGVRKDHFPRRNRIISGLSIGCLIVEAAIKSGSLLTARMAMEQNREVFAIPGSIQNPMVKGCHRLIKEGAYLVEDVHDLLTQLESMTQCVLDFARNDVNEVSQEKDEGDTSLINNIDYHPTSLEKIVERSAMDPQAVTVALLDLEMGGEIVTVPGGFQRI